MGHMSQWDHGKTEPWTMGHWDSGPCDKRAIRQQDNRTTVQWENGRMDAGAKARHNGILGQGSAHGYRGKGALDNAAMRRWGNGTLGTIDNAAFDSGTMDAATRRHRDDEAVEQWTMGPWTLVQWTHGRLDRGTMRKGTVGHWKLAYWDSGAMGREGHGRKDNAQ
jgi:hypothetical protein